MNKTIERLSHRYRIAKNLGLEEEAVNIAIQIAEEAQKEMEGDDNHEKNNI